MAWQSRLLRSVLAVALCYGDVVFGAHNITIDSTNSSIIYDGIWSQNTSPFAFGGSHAFSEDRSATATFNFTGVAIYYMAPLWPYTVNTLVTVDSGTPTVVDMTGSNNGTVGESEDKPSRVLFAQTGLPNTTHTFVASMWSNGIFVVIDALIVTVLDSSDIPPPASTTTDSPPTSSSSSIPSLAAATSATQHRVMSELQNALLAVLSTIVAIVFVAVAIFWVCRRRRKQQWSVEHPSPRPSSRAPSEASDISSELLSYPSVVQIIDLRKQASKLTIATSHEAHEVHLRDSSS